MLKSVVIIGVVGLLVTVGVVSLLPLLGSGADGCCSPSGAPKLGSTGSGFPTLTTENAGASGCCPLASKADSAKEDCCAKPKADTPKAGCCAKPTANALKENCCEKPKALAQSGDPARQVVFQVEGLTCPAAPGRGCGHRIAPVLERLGKIDGVEGCAANYTGTMIRISAKSGADREKVAEAVQKDLAADKRNPARITGDALTKALKDEEWKGSAAAGEKAPKTSAGGKLDPTRQIVLKVEGLTCPAVKGLGCGHRLAPVLARLNKIDVVERSFSNRTGTLLRIALAPSADRDKVAAAVREDLTKDNRKPVLLTGAELKEALEKEEWRLPGELSDIEFRTLALDRVKTFAEAEKLDTETADKLVKIAKQQWERLAKASDCCGKGKQPADWLAQFQQFATSMPEQAKELLTAEQAERLKQALSRRFRQGEAARP